MQITGRMLFIDVAVMHDYNARKSKLHARKSKLSVNYLERLNYVSIKR